MTEAVRDRITGLLAGGINRRQALEAVGVSKQTFYTWLQRAPDFRTAVLAAEGRSL
jgi:transposase